MKYKKYLWFFVYVTLNTEKYFRQKILSCKHFFTENILYQNKIKEKLQIDPYNLKSD